MENPKVEFKQNPVTLDQILNDPDFDILYENSVKFLESLKAKPKPQETLSDIPNPSRRRFLKGAAVAAAVALGGGTISQLEKIIKPPDTPPIPLPKAEKEPINNFNELIKPFIEEAFKKRKDRQLNDPEYFHRVDRELNQDRVNLLIWGYGEEHGESYEDYGGAPTILSYDIRTGYIGVIHFSRDIRVPELEILFPREVISNQRIRSIFKRGGFSLVREISEKMTGLAIDFQILLKDTLVRDAIESLADGSLEIDVSKDHDTGPFRLDGVEYGEERILKGKRVLSTMQLIRYILAEDKNPLGKEDERSYRKNDVFEALVKKVKDKLKTNPLFIKSIINFIQNKVDANQLPSDFDIDLLGRMLQSFESLLKRGPTLLTQGPEVSMPEVNPQQKLVFHDPSFGDGGVTRVHNIKDKSEPARHDNPQVIEEIRQNLLPGWMLIPDGGNPFARDLVNGYWNSTRRMVKEGLLPKAA